MLICVDFSARHCVQNATRFFAVIFTVLLATILAAPAFATNSNDTVTIICKNKSDCDSTGKLGPLFTVENMVPGQTVDRLVTIQNQRKTDGCDLGIKALENTATPQKIQDQLSLRIFEVHTQSNSQSNLLKASLPLSQLLTTTTPLYIDTLNPSSNRNYSWQLYFNSTADNSYQGSELNFDLDLTFTCDVTILEPTPTTVPTPAPTTVPPTPCTTTSPPQAPTLSIEQDRNPTKVKLSWNTISGATGYKLSFATTDAGLRYDNIMIGNASTTQYTVTTLDPQRDYFFSLRAIKGCADGPTSPAVSLLRSTASNLSNRSQQLTSTTDLAEVAARNLEQATTNLTQNSGSSDVLAGATTSGQVLGTQIEVNPLAQFTSDTALTRRNVVDANLLHILVILLAIVAFFVIFQRRKHKSPTHSDTH
jgi:hypothetical protein